MAESSSHQIDGQDETVREATLADYQAVLALDPHGANGLDYLPSTYPALVQGSGVKAYVCEKQGEVAAFVSTRWADGGQTLVTTAARMKGQWRGRGMYVRFTRRVFQKYRGSPNLRFLALGTFSHIMETFGRHLLKQYTVVLEKSITCLEMNVEEMKAVIRSRGAQPSSQLKTLRYHDISAMLQQSWSDLQHLFPEQRMLLHWVPYRIMAENTDAIYNPANHRVFLAKAEELASTSKGSHFPVTVLSSGNHFACERGRSYVLDIFGAGSNTDLRAHLEWHLHRLVEGSYSKEKQAVMRVFCSRRLDDVLDEIREFLPVQPLDLPAYRKAYALEANFSK